MYAIKSGGKVVGYSDTVVYVRLHENGCYVPCDEAEGGGVFVDGEIYHVRGCPVLPGKQTVKLDYYEL